MNRARRVDENNIFLSPSINFIPSAPPPKQQLKHEIKNQQPHYINKRTSIGASKSAKQTRNFISDGPRSREWVCNRARSRASRVAYAARLFGGRERGSMCGAEASIAGARIPADDGHCGWRSAPTRVGSFLHTTRRYYAL